MTNTRFSPFGSTLRRLLDRHGKAQKGLSDVLGISDSMLSCIMRGKRTIKLEWARLLADHLKLTPTEREELINSARATKNFSDIYEPANEEFRDSALMYASNVAHFFQLCDQVIKSCSIGQDERQQEVVICRDLKAFQEFHSTLRKLK